MHNIKNQHILIVEDDHAIATMYRSKLELTNYTVVIAENGLHALSLVKQNIPDLILLDLRMPIMSGDKFLEQFRKSNTTTPVIILTNISRDEAPRTLWHLGISGYFIKAHSTPKDLLNIVNETLKSSII